jgi:hypothetical protein
MLYRPYPESCDAKQYQTEGRVFSLDFGLGTNIIKLCSIVGGACETNQDCAQQLLDLQHQCPDSTPVVGLASVIRPLAVSTRCAECLNLTSPMSLATACRDVTFKTVLEEI